MSGTDVQKCIPSPHQRPFDDHAGLDVSSIPRSRENQIAGMFRPEEAPYCRDERWRKHPPGRPGKNREKPSYLHSRYRLLSKDQTRRRGAVRAPPLKVPGMLSSTFVLVRSYPSWARRALWVITKGSDVRSLPADR